MTYVDVPVFLYGFMLYFIAFNTVDEEKLIINCRFPTAERLKDLFIFRP